MKRTGEAKARQAVAFLSGMPVTIGRSGGSSSDRVGPGKSPSGKVHGATGRKVIED